MQESEGHAREGVMRDRELYARILRIEAPWRVEGVELKLEEKEVVVQVEHGVGELSCP